MKCSVMAVGGFVFGVTVLASALALAGPYSDEMAKCLVKSSSDADKNMLVKWMFAAAALHPAVQSIASVSDAERSSSTRRSSKSSMPGRPARGA